MKRELRKVEVEEKWRGKANNREQRETITEVAVRRSRLYRETYYVVHHNLLKYHTNIV